MLIFLPCGNSSIREMMPRFQLSAFISNLVLLLAASIDALSSNDLISDSNALLEFSYSVPHARKLNWSQSTSLCTSWVGVICSQDGTQVHEIHLPAFGLYGRIPQQTLGRLKSLRVLSLRSNYLNGTLPPDLLSIPSLQFVFLQNNNLSGGLPIYLSSKLTVLDLSFNSLSGQIPSTVGNLTTLSVLNLQSNSFSGNIPSLDLPALQVLNLSHNSLSGPIPDSLRNLPVSSFVGNSLLCGPPLNSCLLVSPSPSPSAAAGGERLYGQRKLGATIATGVAGACLVFITFSAVVFFCLKRKNKGRSRTNRIIAKAENVGQTENLKSDDFGSGVQGAEKNKLVFLDGCSFVFDLEDLLRASAEVLGKGSYGTAYRAILDESNSVVVKRLKDVGGIGKKEFEQQMEIIGGAAAAAAAARHPNVAPLLAYYFSQDEKLLVYRYMPGGSLSSALHGNREMERRPLDWESRLNIALNAARGLAHIHSICGALNIHGNIKSSNVLLAADLTACISDFGLSPMMSFIPVNSRVPGYQAPEVIETRKVNQKSDVYGFGVVLLEMLTGKSPVQSSGRDEVVVDLPRWVRSVVREEWTAEVFDVQLTKGKYIEEEMVQMLQIGLSCVAKAADMRPAMDDVVRMIEDVRASSVDNQSKGSNADTP